MLHVQLYLMGIQLYYAEQGYRHKYVNLATEIPSHADVQVLHGYNDLIWGRRKDDDSLWAE